MKYKESEVLSDQDLLEELYQYLSSLERNSFRYLHTFAALIKRIKTENDQLFYFFKNMYSSWISDNDKVGLDSQLSGSKIDNEDTIKKIKTSLIKIKSVFDDPDKIWINKEVKRQAKEILNSFCQSGNENEFDDIKVRIKIINGEEIERNIFQASHFKFHIDDISDQNRKIFLKNEFQIYLMNHHPEETKAVSMVKSWFGL